MTIRAWPNMYPRLEMKDLDAPVIRRQASPEELADLEALIMERRLSFGFITDPDKARELAVARIREARSLQRVG